MLNRLRQVPVTPTGIPNWGVHFNLIRIDGPLPAELRPFLRGLRNSVAHASFEFTSGGAEISGLKFSPRTLDRPPKILWQATFDLDQLRSFLLQLTHEVEEACALRHPRGTGATAG
jgi:hypothetical protein